MRKREEGFVALCLEKISPTLLGVKLFITSTKLHSDGWSSRYNISSIMTKQTSLDMPCQSTQPKVCVVFT